MEHSVGYEVIDRQGLGGALHRHPTSIIDRGVSIDISADVTIGAQAVIAEDVLILTHDHRCPGYPQQDAVQTSSLVIGAHAFIGARAIVLASVRLIGEGAMVGAGSVVTHDVPAHELWAGSPARPIRTL